MTDRIDGITVLVADDHAEFRAGLHALFSAVADITVLGEAADGTDAVTQAVRLQPDVVLDGHQHARPGRHRGHPADHARPAHTSASWY